MKEAQQNRPGKHLNFLRSSCTLLIASACFLIVNVNAQNKNTWDSLQYHASRGEWKVVVMYYDTLLEKSPWSTHLLLLKGEVLYESNQYEEAIDVFGKAIALNDNLVDAKIRRGKAYFCLGKYDSSIRDLSAAYGKYRYQDSLIFLYRGYIYSKMNKPELAKRDYDSAMQFCASESEFHCRLGTAIAELHEPLAALLELNKAVQLDPRNLDARKFRALVNYQLGHPQTAISDSWLYLRHFPNDQNLNLILAWGYFLRKQYEEAHKHISLCKDMLKTKEAYTLSGYTNYYLVNDTEAIADMAKAQQFPMTTEEKIKALLLTGICKNNLSPGTGCNELTKAKELGSEDAKKMLLEECK